MASFLKYLLLIAILGVTVVFSALVGVDAGVVAKSPMMAVQADGREMRIVVQPDGSDHLGPVPAQYQPAR